MTNAPAPVAEDVPLRPLLALLWMLGAIASFLLMSVAGRAILQEFDTFELMLYRSAIGFVAVAIIIALSPRGFAQVRTRHPGLHVTRNLFHFTGQNLWFFALGSIPLAQLAALEFTAPIWVALLAPMLLGEMLTRPRIIAAALAFIGVLIVAQPGASPIGPGHLAALGAAVTFALNTIYTRRIMAFDDVLCVVFWMTLSQGLMSFFIALPGGIPLPSPGILPWLAVVGLTGLSAHYALTSALGWAPANVVAPMEFLRLPAAAVLGAVIYGEPLSVAVFAGAVLIIGGNLSSLRSERRRRPD